MQEQTGNSFSRVVAVATLLFLGFVFLCGCLHAQNSGTVGIQARFTPVFTNVAASTSSAIFKDIGSGVNILRYCTTSFQGSINLEWSPTGQLPFFPLSVASWPSGDTACHSISFNGYFPNARSTLVRTAGSVNAWFTSISGPSGASVPAVSSSGPESPLQCDLTGTFLLGQSSTVSLVTGVAGQTIYVCQVNISFAAVPSAGDISLGPGGAACAGYAANWQTTITANTPQQLPQFGGPLGSFLRIQNGQNLCIQSGAITANARVSISFAQLTQ